MKIYDTYDRVSRCEDFLKSLLNISRELEDYYNCPFGFETLRGSQLYYLVKDNDDFEYDFYFNLYEKLDRVISSLQQHLLALNKRVDFEEDVQQFNATERLDEDWEEAVND